MEGGLFHLRNTEGEKLKVNIAMAFKDNYF